MTCQEAKDLHIRIINKGKYLFSHEVKTMDICRKFIDRSEPVPLDAGKKLMEIYERIKNARAKRSHKN